MIAQLRETLADLRSDHDAFCSLLIKEGVIRAKGLAQGEAFATCRGHLARVFTHVLFRHQRCALAATRFMARDDHAALRTTSKQRMSATSSAVIPSKILVADLVGPTELFDTTSGRWEKLSHDAEGPHPATVSRDPWTSLRLRRFESTNTETMQFCRIFRPASEEMAVVASDVCAPNESCSRGGWRSHVRVWQR